MMPTPGGRRAGQFAELLAAPARTNDPELAPYVALAGALRAVPVAAGPAPEFRDALRQRLMAVATVQGIGQPERAMSRVRAAGITWNFQRRVSIVAGAAAAVTAVAGVGIGASRSLPGDAFYGVKRATENAQLALTTGTEAKGKRHLEFARTRLHEVESLVGQNSALTDFIPGRVGALGHLTSEAKTSTIVATLNDMDAETRAGANDLVAAYKDSGSAEPLRALDTFTHDQFSDLRDVVPALPTEAQPRAERSLSLLALISGQTRQIALGSGGASTGGAGSAGRPTHSPSAAATPNRTQTPKPGHQDGGSSSTAPSTPSSPGLPTIPNPVTTQVPSIPPLPTILPLPTQLPSTLPTLPSLTELPLLGH